MKTVIRIVSFFAALLGFLLPAKAQEGSGFLYMINVGKGDAVVLSTGGANYLIDCGKAGAWSRVEDALSALSIDTLDGVFLTHTDKDHAGGLKKLAKSDIKIKNWYASAYWTGGGEHPMESAAARRGQTVTFLKAGDTVDGLFTVLAPLSFDSEDEDENSLVMMFSTPCVRILLTGDMEKKEEKALVRSDADLTCDVFKVPNHADDDVLKHIDLKNLGAGTALISTDPYEKPGTPDPLLVQMLEEAGMTVYRTDLAAMGIRVDFGPEGITVTEE